MFFRDKKYKPQTHADLEKKQGAFIQPKLTFGKPGDKYEVEADTMAAKVVNKPTEHKTIQKKEEQEEIQQKPLASEVTPFIQKAESSEEESVQQKQEEEENKVQKMEEEEAVQSKEEEEETVQSKCEKCEKEDKVQKQEDEEAQAKPNKGSANLQTNSIEGQLRRGQGGGKMDAQTRNDMESGFGADFSHVNIHTDSQAAQMSANIGAQAFTHGNDIYFNKGKYNPTSKEGKTLLAHELTHTIQQKGMVQKKIQKACGSAAVGPTPSNCVLVNKPPLGRRFLFKSNCDDFETGEEGSLRAFARSIASGSRVEVLGMASSDGNASYNESLSCHRANRMASVIHSEGIMPNVIEATGEVAGTDGNSSFRAAAINVTAPSVPTPVPQPQCTTPSFVPGSSTLTSIGLRGGCGSGADFISHDFPGVPAALRRRSLYSPMSFLSDTGLENRMRSELSFFAGSLGVSLFNHFNIGSGSTLSHGIGTALSREVNSSPTFASLSSATITLIESQIRAQVLASCHIDWTKFNVLPTAGSLPGANFNVLHGDTLTLNAVLGGTQGLEVFIRDFNFDSTTNTFSGVLRFKICDDFGVDHSDMDPLNPGHGSPGLVAFWILQHERPSRHVAYINNVFVERSFSGVL
ncbi:eCIS core domain-containing protein [Tenacibaculum sp. TC6]|uniref:eCIS core domain-containing protein n=1 Tax=Tenacibaculum sp. TC6 TaxID=3423223 RepID=UPI003D35AE3A